MPMQETYSVKEASLENLVRCQLDVTRSEKVVADIVTTSKPQPVNYFGDS